MAKRTQGTIESELDRRKVELREGSDEYEVSEGFGDVIKDRGKELAAW